MPMRILFIAPNQQTIVHPVPPLGVMYLTSICRSRGHTVQAVDMMFQKNPLDAIERAIRAFEPQLVGISIRNLDALISKSRCEMPSLKRCVERVRALTSVPLILGGPAFSIFPEETMAELEADYGIAGEADESLPLFLDRLSRNEDLADIPGLCDRRRQPLRANPLQLVQDLDRIPHQALDVIEHGKYRRYRGNMGVFTRRGCPLSCSYCPEPRVHGHAARLRSPKRVVDEIEYIIDQTGSRWFDLADSLFNLPREHALRVCQEIVDRKVRIKFEVELNPLGQDEESVKLLKAAGCIGVDLTADSGSERMLESLNKGFTSQMVMDVARLYQKHRIPYTVGFLLGGPGESLQTLNETLDFAGRLPGVSSSYFAVGIRVYPGTALETVCGRENLSAPTSWLPPYFYVSGGFDPTCANRLIAAYRQNFRFYLTDLFYEGTLAKSIQMADLFNVRPLWGVGRLPRVMDWLVSGGFPRLRWDPQTRCFTTKGPTHEHI